MSDTPEVPMIVYVVQQISDDGYVDEVIGVYSTKERAEKTAAATPRTRSDWDCHVIAFEVDGELVTP